MKAEILKTTNGMEIKIDHEVLEHMKQYGEDYRVSTSCNGPALAPIEAKPSKDSDLIIKIGHHKLFISGHQYMIGLRHITKAMLGVHVCKIEPDMEESDS